MSDKIDTGGFAFACAAVGREGQPNHLQEGMTLLDYFAAKAMQGILIANHPALDWKSISREAYLTASAMLSEKRRIEGGL